VWLKLKIETKMRKGKYASKIKTDHLDREGQLSFSFPYTGYDEEYFLLKFFENNHKCVPFGLFITKIIHLLLLLIFFIISLFFRFILNIK
jgi:hypothetical protein